MSTVPDMSLTAPTVGTARSLTALACAWMTVVTWPTMLVTTTRPPVTANSVAGGGLREVGRGAGDRAPSPISRRSVSLM
jgi:hypothetical protein